MKIIVAEDEEELREMISLTLESAFGAETIAVKSGNEAITQLKNHPNVDAIISDLNMPDGNGLDLFNFVKKMDSPIPFILCSTESPEGLTQFKNRGFAGFVEKPFIQEPLIALINKIFAATPLAQTLETPTFVRIFPTTLLRMGTLISDVYLKLSESKYLKFMNKGDSFTLEDVQKLYKKKLQVLYIKQEDTKSFITNITNHLKLLIENRPSESQTDKTIEKLYSSTVHQTVHAIVDQVGITPEVRELTLKGIQRTVAFCQKNPQLSKMLENLTLDPNSYLSSHSVALANAACSFASILGWESESTFFKLTTAAFFHDLSLPNDLIARARSFEDLSKEPYVSQISNEDAFAFQEHTKKAARLANDLGEAGAEIDTIILQHHERPDGSGFPQKLNYLKIAPLAAVFIAAHDLIYYIDQHEKLWSIEGFIADGKKMYTQGLFKKLITAIEEKHLNPDSKPPTI